jgi:hypothetical protein
MYLYSDTACIGFPLSECPCPCLSPCSYSHHEHEHHDMIMNVNMNMNMYMYIDTDKDTDIKHLGQQIYWYGRWVTHVHCKILAIKVSGDPPTPQRINHQRVKRHLERLPDDGMSLGSLGSLYFPVYSSPSSRVSTRFCIHHQGSPLPGVFISGKSWFPEFTTEESRLYIVFITGEWFNDFQLPYPSDSNELPGVCVTGESITNSKNPKNILKKFEMV